MDGFHFNVRQFCLKNIVRAYYFQCFRFYFNQCVFRFLACSHLPSLTFMTIYDITDFKSFMFSSFWFTFHARRQTHILCGGRERGGCKGCVPGGWRPYPPCQSVWNQDVGLRGRAPGLLNIDCKCNN